MRPRPLVVIVWVLSLCPGGTAESAELRLRESLLAQQRDRATITIQAVVDEIGRQAHVLAEDCDLHVPLRSREIWVPLIGELKNACSEPPGVSATHWRDEIFQETHGRASEVVGVFRIWQEHPPSGAQVEGRWVPWYEDSNPDHQVELHPLLKIGSLDFLSHVRLIEQGNTQFAKAYGANRLPEILGRKIEIERVLQDGAPFVRIRGQRVGFNHWQLRARLVDDPEALADGTRVRVDILAGNQVVPGALGVPLVTITGTAADDELSSLSTNDIVEYQALVRLNLDAVLDQINTTPQAISLPLEFVALWLEED